jgi:RNA polymerase-binding protein DksA
MIEVVEYFRTSLLEERTRVLGAIEYLHEENAGSMDDEVDETHLDNHLAESATATVDREVDYTLEENSEHVLAEIDAALERIDDGTFGVCMRCGKEIPRERLEAIPYTTECIDCKREVRV